MFGFFFSSDLLCSDCFTGIPLNALACIGWLDGTFIEIARPGNGHQECAYNGKESCHGLKFLLLAHPDGIISFCHGPVEGRHHDSFLLDESQLLALLRTRFLQLAQRFHFCIFGDVAFPLSDELITAYRNPQIQQEETFNACVKLVRVAVEWAIGKVTKTFPHLTARKADFHRVLLSPVGLHYRVAVLLANAHTCLYGNQTSSYFEVMPIPLEEYFWTKNTQLQLLGIIHTGVISSK